MEMIMTITNSKVVILADYAKARALLTFEDVREALVEKAGDLRKLDRQVIKLKLQPHKFQDVRPYRD